MGLLPYLAERVEEKTASGYATGSAAARVQVAYIGFWFDVG
jgi:hypothetical protein